MKTIYETIDRENYFEIVLNERELEAICEGDIVYSCVPAGDDMLQLSLRKYSKREEKENAFS